MGVKFFSIFILFFVLSSIFLFYRKSITLIVKSSDPASVALMRFKNVISYEITPQGISTVLDAKIADKYKDRDELYDVHMIKNDFDNQRRISAKKAIYKDDILTLIGDVVYKDTLSRTLRSDTVVYNIKEDILSSKTHFVSSYGKNVFEGSSFVYYLHRKMLIATDIKADIYMEKP